MGTAQSLKFKFFDVGHGDSILIRFPNGKLGLVDCNFQANQPDLPVIREIRDNGGKLEFVCMTHPHDDHFRGMLSVFNAEGIVVKSFWHPMASALESVLRFYSERSVPECEGAEFVSDRMLIDCNYGELLDIFELLEKKSFKLDRRINEFQELESIGGVKIHCLSPPYEYVNRYERKLKKALTQVISLKEYRMTRDYPNRLSIVLLLIYGKSKIILGGDALRENWRHIRTGIIKRDLDFEHADCFKVSHHGASDSFYHDMWSRYLGNEGVLVVSCGRLCHPSSEFIDSINGRWKIYCTNKGKACITDGDTMNPDGLKLGLDLLAHDISSGKKCCSTIDLDIYQDSRIKISLARDVSRKCGNGL